MNKWIIFNKFIILIYCALKYIQGGYGKDSLIILGVLLYIAINMIYYIMNKKELKNMADILSIVLIICLGSYVNSIFLFIIPINYIQFIYSNNFNNTYTIGLIFISPIFIHNSIRGEYFLILLFSYLIYILAYKSNYRIEKLLEENDILREKNDILFNKINKDLEYENQIMYTSKLEERNKIAQEMHDKIGHTISGSLMQLEAAKLLMDKDKEKAGLFVDNTIKVLREGIESIRITLRNIKPASEQMGINRIRLMLNEVSSRTNIRCNLMHSGNLQNITYAHWKIIYDSIKECITNTIKYSKATIVTVNIQIFNKIIKVEVRDNGIGSFDIKKSMGIKGMEERCEEIGGKVVIDGSKGFSVILILPIK
ncbi:sensor histidine kinase [Clostridium lundense]|uniref:sensor histidine kinase n=1 Tax=Clostridium lundense TaxID=319475 RepID=UPI0004842F13|nr:sensor histidine kinase [Clostridium lundense]